MNLASIRSRVETTLGPAAAREKVALIAVLIFYILVQLVNIGRGGHMGQDWVTQRQWLNEALSKPWDWLNGNFFQTNPPLYHLLMAPFLVFLRTRFALEAMGLANVFVSVVSLLVFWKTLQIMVSSVWIRFAALLSVTFLPACVIGSVVIATDAFCQLPICILGLCLALYATDKIRWYQALLTATFTAAFAVSIKATAIALIPAVIIGFVLAARTLKQLGLGLFAGLALFGLSTGALGLYWNFRHSANVTMHFQSGKSEQTPPQLMNLRSALFFRSGDGLLFNGEPAWELYRNSAPSLAISNSFSYPGLVWYGLHTDVLDVLQPHKRVFSWGYFGIRTAFSRKISRTSVRFGFVTFCAAVVGITVAAMYALRLYFLRSDRRSGAVLGILALAGGWTAAMTTIMLTVTHSYTYQYWHPRLVLPAVILFAIPVAWISSHLLQGRPRLQMALLAGSVCQTIIHLGVVLGR